jgi:hypothetical protein
MPRLPVSGIKVALNMPDGADDMAIVEALGSSVTRALAILPRLTRIDGEDASPRDIWASLTVTDFEYALLALRIWLFGEQIACAFDCPHPNCGERVEVSFRASDVIGTVRPVQPRGVRPDPARPDWFRLEDAGAAFRLPTVGDQAAVLGLPDGPRRLGQMCIEPPDLRARQRARVERAMEQLAPEVSREVEGQCPGCGNILRATLHVPTLVVEELRRAAAGIHDEIHLIARAYQWSEAAILALPRTRRRSYADRIRHEGG